MTERVTLRWEPDTNYPHPIDFFGVVYRQKVQTSVLCMYETSIVNPSSVTKDLLEHDREGDAPVDACSEVSQLYIAYPDLYCSPLHRNRYILYISVQKKKKLLYQLSKPDSHSFFLSFLQNLCFSASDLFSIFENKFNCFHLWLRSPSSWPRISPLKSNLDIAVKKVKI